MIIQHENLYTPSKFTAAGLNTFTAADLSIFTAADLSIFTAADLSKEPWEDFAILMKIEEVKILFSDYFSSVYFNSLTNLFACDSLVFASHIVATVYCTSSCCNISRHLMVGFMLD